MNPPYAIIYLADCSSWDLDTKIERVGLSASEGHDLDHYNSEKYASDNSCEIVDDAGDFSNDVLGEWSGDLDLTQEGTYSITYTWHNDTNDNECYHDSFHKSIDVKVVSKPVLQFDPYIPAGKTDDVEFIEAGDINDAHYQFSSGCVQPGSKVRIMVASILDIDRFRYQIDLEGNYSDWIYISWRDNKCFRFLWSVDSTLGSSIIDDSGSSDNEQYAIYTAGNNDNSPVTPQEELTDQSGDIIRYSIYDDTNNDQSPNNAEELINAVGNDWETNFTIIGTISDDHPNPYAHHENMVVRIPSSIPMNKIDFTMTMISENLGADEDVLVLNGVFASELQFKVLDQYGQGVPYAYINEDPYTFPSSTMGNIDTTDSVVLKALTTVLNASHNGNGNTDESGTGYDTYTGIREKNGTTRITTNLYTIHWGAFESSGLMNTYLVRIVGKFSNISRYIDWNKISLTTPDDNVYPED